MHVLALLLSIALLAGCASAPRASKYVGKPEAVLIASRGKPSMTVPLPDGTRQLVYINVSSDVVNGHVWTTTTTHTYLVDKDGVVVSLSRG